MAIAVWPTWIDAGSPIFAAVRPAASTLIRARSLSVAISTSVAGRTSPSRARPRALAALDDVTVGQDVAVLGEDDRPSRCRWPVARTARSPTCSAPSAVIVTTDGVAWAMTSVRSAVCTVVAPVVVALATPEGGAGAGTAASSRTASAVPPEARTADRTAAARTGASRPPAPLRDRDARRRHRDRAWGRQVVGTGLPRIRRVGTDGRVGRGHAADSRRALRLCATVDQSSLRRA